mgnify:CR=1 FL=1
MKEDGEGLDLLERIAGDESFGLSLDDLQGLTDPRKFIGRAPEQVTRFLNEEVEPLLAPVSYTQLTLPTILLV